MTPPEIPIHSQHKNQSDANNESSPKATDTRSQLSPGSTTTHWRASFISKLPPRLGQAFGMQRYTVTVVSGGNGTSNSRPVLLIPFRPDALVTAFIDELYRRVAKQGLDIAPNTHVATLHLDSETGALIDAEDLLGDVVSDPKTDKIFSLFTKKNVSDTTPNGPSEQHQHLPAPPASLPIRIVTARTAKDRQACPIIYVPLKSTFKELHEQIAQQIQHAANFAQDADSLECNCKLANHVSAIATPPNTMLLVYGKSEVERLEIAAPTEIAVKAALRQRFGQDYELTKRLALIGGDMDINNTSVYKKAPVAAICSRQRHTPVHARVDIDESGHSRSKVLDLHTAEIPISPSCNEAKLEDVDLTGLMNDGAIEIFAVSRVVSGQNTQAVGKSNIFRARAHWEPAVIQTDRGMAMFLSSLRVFASLVQDMSEDERSQDAVLHVFDLLTAFPPALRALNILIQGKTPTMVESAGLSSAMFAVLETFAPENIIGSDKSRVFEVARLFFGFVLEKARTLKLPVTVPLPYLTALQEVDVADHMTGEGVQYAVQTNKGLVEASLYQSLEDGLLASTHLQTGLTKLEVPPDLARIAFLAGGALANVTAFANITELQYPDAGNVNAAIDLSELSELSHLAELCGRNKLAVHRPSQLSSAVHPCLTFDRQARLAVYTGEQPCGEPGQSSILFRPHHGEETIDTTVIEQLIAPILRSHEADGTAVFDALGGAAVRNLQRPDEILMFCVDCSASMRQATDFEEVNEDMPFDDEEADIQNYVDADFYNRASFEDMKENLCRYEAFEDMLAIVAGTQDSHKRYVIGQVIDILRGMLATEIIKKSESLTNRRGGRYYGRHQINVLEDELNKIKEFWAGLKTHENSLRDFILFRSSSSSRDISARWVWSIGDALPSAGQLQQIPTLPSDVTDLPHHISCPISHTLMEDAVSASDGHTYSNLAIQQWFRIRGSSPMTGLELQDTSVQPNATISEAATKWSNGEGIVDRILEDRQPAKRIRSEEIEVAFESRLGTFTRRISPNLTLKQLYMLAFRGLKGRAMTFQLTTELYGPLTPSPEASVSSRNIRNGSRIQVRIAEDDPTGTASGNAASAHDHQVLIKVYSSKNKMEFGYWVKRDNAMTMASIIWKHWRYKFGKHRHVNVTEKQVWIDLSNSGDGHMTGNPLSSTERLSQYLNRSHCFGHMGEEPVYNEDSIASTSSGTGQPLVLKCEVSAPWKPARDCGRLSRIDVLKQMFEAFINRLVAYNFRTHCGLITFATTPNVAMNISHVLENFRRATQDMKAEGDTAIWDALALAKDQLVDYGNRYPEAKKRIICISDGDDTKSVANKPDDICWRLRQAGIAVDTISLGGEDSASLRTISNLLGCYSLHPTSLVNALAITEMEPFLSLTERPPISPPAMTPHNRLQYMAHFSRVKYSTRYTVVTPDQVPPRKEHPNLHDDFVQVSVRAARTGAAGTAGSGRTNLRNTRLLSEMRAISTRGSDATYDVYISESDFSFMKIVMDGPQDSPYANGTFVLYVHADESYPTFAPKARFITKMIHPNINAHGRICHSILTRDWTSDISMTTLLDSIYGLLLQPEHSDPVNTITTLGFHHDQVEFEEEVREHVQRYASQSRHEWKRELLGEVDEEDGMDY